MADLTKQNYQIPIPCIPPKPCSRHKPSQETGPPSTQLLTSKSRQSPFRLPPLTPHGDSSPPSPLVYDPLLHGAAFCPSARHILSHFATSAAALLSARLLFPLSSEVHLLLIEFQPECHQLSTAFPEATPVPVSPHVLISSTERVHN